MIHRIVIVRGSPVVALLCAVLLAALGPVAGATEQRAAAAASGIVSGSLLVTTTGDQATSAMRRLVGAGEGAVLSHASVTPITEDVTEVRVPQGEMAAAVEVLRQQAGVLAVEPNVLRPLQAAPNDVQYAQQWAHQLAGIEPAWDISTGSSAVTVAIIDSGVAANHPDLAGRVVEQLNVSTGKIQPGSTENDACRIGHGTWVAGVIGAVGGNGTDVVGVNWRVSILDIAGTHPQASCIGVTDSSTIAGIDYAIQRRVDVINLSFSGAANVCPMAYQRTIDRARTAGILVVAAAGNDGFDIPNVPASCNGVVSVAAVGPDGARAVYSTSNPYVDVAAPGGGGSIDHDPAVDVLTTSVWDNQQPTGSTLAVPGTSFAAPYVTGLAALLRSVDPTLGPDQLESVIERTARDVGAPGRDPAYGWGIIHAGDAVALVNAGQSIPAPEPDNSFPLDG